MKEKTAYICSNCGTIGMPIAYTPGSGWIELILWFCFFIPGLIYSIWRWSSIIDVCPECGKDTMVPLNTPMGEKLFREMGMVLDKNNKEK
jgi:hypothetical protein